MTVRNAILTIVAGAVVFALLGGFAGAILGVVAPDYYRTVLYRGHSADFNPLQVGMGLGVTQGLATGVAIAMVIVAVFAWRDASLLRGSGDPSTTSSTTSPRRWLYALAYGSFTVVAVGVFSGVAFVFGGIVGQTQIYENLANQRIKRITATISLADYPGISTGRTSEGHAYLTGTVKDEATRDALRTKLAQAFGTEEAAEIVGPLDVPQ